MFQNPEYTHSRVLLQLLLEETNRIKQKLSHAPCIEANYQRLSREIQNRNQLLAKNKVLIKETKSEGIESLELSRRKRANLEKQVRETGNILNSLLHQVKKLKLAVKSQEQQTKQLAEAYGTNQEAQNKIITQINQISEQLEFMSEQRIRLAKQLEIGCSRISSQRNYAIKAVELLKSTQTEVNSNKQQIRTIMSEIQKTKLDINEHEDQLFHLKTSCMEEEHLLQEQALRKKMQMDKVDDLLNKIQEKSVELEQSKAKGQQLGQKYDKKLAACKQIESNTRLAQTEAKSKERQNNLVQHKIQCVQMLMNVLYGCRDQLIDLRRNPQSSRYRTYQSRLLKPDPEPQFENYKDSENPI